MEQINRRDPVCQMVQIGGLFLRPQAFLGPECFLFEGRTQNRQQAAQFLADADHVGPIIH